MRNAVDVYFASIMQMRYPTETINWCFYLATNTYQLALFSKNPNKLIVSSH